MQPPECHLDLQQSDCTPDQPDAAAQPVLFPHPHMQCKLHRCQSHQTDWTEAVHLVITGRFCVKLCTFWLASEVFKYVVRLHSLGVACHNVHDKERL